ncbi:MAG: hypothetical protein O3C57_06595 [Verrucomicrobia bacterium]|nr:hypothetical protein [Verrucomicrobiota bacterium]
MFFTSANSIAPSGPHAFTASGTAPLWKLPPGDFAPVFVILTERGAVTLHALQYDGLLAGKELEGKQVPRWLGFVADAMGAIAANGPVTCVISIGSAST